jgi:hypothetical protein
MTSVYLVEGSWWHHDEGAVWVAAAFTTSESAERWCADCQAWIDQYVADFWTAFVTRFGEPERRQPGCTYFHMRDENEQTAGFEFEESWFGYGYDEPETFGQNKMRALSPDPLVECLAGEACKYRVVEVMLNPIGKTAVEARMAQEDPNHA